MGTSATISMDVNNKVKAIYCHFDGYPNHTGVTLKRFYTNDKLIKELIDGGPCSFLDKNINEIERSNNNKLYVSYNTLEEMYRKRSETSYYYHWDSHQWNLVTNHGQFISPI